MCMTKMIITGICIILSINILTAKKQEVIMGSKNIYSIKKINGEPISTAKIDEIVEFYIKEASVTGLSLSILNENKISYVKSYGFRDKENDKLLDENSVMGGASFSKFLFSYIVMQLVEEDVIDLDKPLYKYLEKPIPEYEIYSDLKGSKYWKNLTARICLNHSTGFPNSRMFNTDHKLDFFFRPGSKTGYSGEGIYLLQFVIEEITGRSLEEIAVEKVFEPLKMDRSSYIWQDKFENNYAIGHNILEENIDYRQRVRANAGGSLLTTAKDYSRFIEAIMQKKGLSKMMFDEMLSPSIRIKSKHQFPSISNDTTNENDAINLSYGLGCVVIDTDYGRAFFKEGHDFGFQNYTITFLEPKVAIVIMTNSDNGEMIFKNLLEELIGHSFTPWKWEQYIPYIEITEQSIGRYLYDIIMMDNIENAVETYKKINQSVIKERFIFNEAELNNLGYQMLKEGKVQNAIKIFQLNTDEYPNSANVYDSLAEAYLMNNQKDLAIKYYEKSIELNPDNKNASLMIKKLLE